MLPFLLLANRFIGIDLGSQFMKLAESVPEGDPRIFTDPMTDSIRVPSAAGLRFLEPKSFPLSEDDFSDIEVRFGAQALTILRRNPALGYEFLPRAIARNRTEEFHTGESVEPAELFLLMIQNACRLVQPFRGIGIALPYYFARQQLSVVHDAIKAFQIPLVSFMSDIQAIASWYTVVKMRPGDEGRHVLFVDVGATAAKVYALRFVGERGEDGKSFVIANQTASAWSEKVGGYHFAKAIAAEKEVSFRKAQKWLIKKGGFEYEELFEDALEILEDTVADVIDRATEIAPIDEIQLLGGASSYKFVVDAVREITNVTAKRDLNQNEAVALGTVATILMIEKQAPYPQVILNRLPPFSFSVKCGSRIADYCQKEERCYDWVRFVELEEVCNEFSIIADPATIPEGIDPVFVTYQLTTPVTLVSPDHNYTMKMGFHKPDPAIWRVEVCTSDDQCEEEQFEPLNDYGEEADRAFFFISNYLDALAVKDLRIIVANFHGQLSEFREQSESELTDEMAAELDRISDLRENGEFEELTHPELVEFAKKLTEMAKALKIPLQGPP